MAALKLLLQKRFVHLGGRAGQGEKKKETETFEFKLHGDCSCCSQPCELVCITAGLTRAVPQTNARKELHQLLVIS